jgi:glycosyltransferase involved in cell wall biosynthesis
VPSLAEGFPTIIVEGMAQGLIPIATDVGAVREIVNEKNGLLLDSISGESLANTIKIALSLPKEEKLKLKLNARKQVDTHFNWPQTITQLVKDIENCLDSWKRTHS